MKAGFPAYAALGLALTVSNSAWAIVISYPDFSSTAGLTLVGDAAPASTADGNVLRLTQATVGQHGAAYSTSATTLGPSATFSTKFQFRFTETGGIDPADGITFVLAADPTGLGDAGGGLGYQGVPNSVAIEFDTYNNGGADISDNHIAVDTNGVLTNSGAASAYGVDSCHFSPVDGCMSDGHVWTVNISYDGATQLLDVVVQDAAIGLPFVALNDYSIDIASFLGTNTAYVGFTGATGSGFENQDILNWIFADTAVLPAAVDVPEPGTLALFGSGLALFATFRRRRKAKA